jgi:hypothetical protein
MNQQMPEGSDDPRMVGSNAWAADGGGRLGFFQQCGQLWDANRAYLIELPGELRWVLSSRGLCPAARPPEVGVQPLPQTRAVEAATQALERFAEGEREVVNHSYRTFHFADLLHRQDSVMEMDREVLAVAMILHDVGIYPRAVAELAGQDFTVRGANLVRRIGQEAGWSQYRIDLAAQAVTLNANGLVGRRWGAEAYYGRLAPLVDAVGQPWKIHGQDAGRVFAEHPAQGLTPAILKVVREEAARAPGSRFALWKPLFPFLMMNCEARWHRHLS